MTYVRAFIHTFSNANRARNRCSSSKIARFSLRNASKSENSESAFKTISFFARSLRVSIIRRRSCSSRVRMLFSSVIRSSSATKLTANGEFLVFMTHRPMRSSRTVLINRSCCSRCSYIRSFVFSRQSKFLVSKSSDSFRIHSRRSGDTVRTGGDATGVSCKLFSAVSALIVEEGDFDLDLGPEF